VIWIIIVNITVLEILIIHPSTGNWPCYLCTLVGINVHQELYFWRSFSIEESNLEELCRSCRKSRFLWRCRYLVEMRNFMECYQLLLFCSNSSQVFSSLSLLHFNMVLCVICTDDVLFFLFGLFHLLPDLHNLHMLLWKLPFHTAYSFQLKISEDLVGQQICPLFNCWGNNVLGFHPNLEQGYIDKRFWSMARM